MKSFNLIFITIILLIFHNCKYIKMDFVDDKLRIVNNSDHDIVSLVNFNYPDTSFHNSEINQYTTSGDTGNIIVINSEWERKIKKVNSISIFIVNKDSLDKYKYNWKLNIKPEKKMVLNEADLDSLNWLITFP